MSIISSNYSPSVNILRDNEVDFKYTSTRNSTNVFNKIFSNTLHGTKSHIVIGAYGTGKSSLLLAINQTLSKKKIHFSGQDALLKRLPQHEFLNIVGDYRSLSDYFAEYFQLDPNYTVRDIFKALSKLYSSLQKKNKGLAIVIDEFGKFLEYAAKNMPERELYFIQQLAEWVNTPSNATVLIATLHQDFSSYSLGLTKNQQQEWSKVKGRFNELVFNEPVEQLLYVASERVFEKFKNSTPNKNSEKHFNTIKSANVFPLREHLDLDFAKKMYPFDILSAAILTLALQEYGQNERSLFSFIESQDYNSINDFKPGNYFYSVSSVYDYLINNFYTVLSSRYNKHYSQWAAIRNSLERVEAFFPEDTQPTAISLIKTIGLLNIFGSAAAKLDATFYTSYLRLSMGFNKPDVVLKELETQKIIRFQRHSSRFILVEGTDLDIEVAIDDAGKLIERTSNFLEHLNQYFDFPFICAKAIFYQTGTPRFFQVKLSDAPLLLSPEGEIDGYVNLIFNEDSNVKRKIIEASKNCSEPILYGLYRNTGAIQSAIFEIQKIKKVIHANSNDRAAISALNEIKNHYIKLLNHYVLDALYTNNGNIIWYYGGKEICISDRQSFNQTLSRICREVYTQTPVFRNELINKSKVSGQVSTARLRLIQKLLAEANCENLGFSENEFPPEKSIYLSLLKNTGIHNHRNGFWELSMPLDRSFTPVWEVGNTFLESSKNKERSLQDYIDMLLSKPFKLKLGLIDFWIPIFLIAKFDEFALYEGDRYVPQLSKDVLELINKKPSLFKIKAFDIAGIKLELFNRYRLLLNQPETSRPSSKLFIQTVKPFLIFYRDLPEYAKQTTRLSKNALSIRNVIAQARDPEKTFFEDFPTAIGYSLQELQQNNRYCEQYIAQLQEAIKELRTCYDGLASRFEDFLCNCFHTEEKFPAYKRVFKERYGSIKTHLLLTKQKSFFDKLFSPMDDKKAWLNSLAQSGIGKPLSSFTDKDEVLLYERISDLVYELDNLCELSKTEIDEHREDIIKIEITSFVEGLTKNLIRIPKKKDSEIVKKTEQIRQILGRDKKLNVTVLMAILQELLNNEKES